MQGKLPEVRPQKPWSERIKRGFKATPSPLEEYAAGWVENRRPIYLGVSSVPLPGSADAAAGTSAGTQPGTGGAAAHSGSSSLSESDSEAEEAPYERLAPGQHLRGNVRVHMRRLDTAAALRRRLVAAIDVAAPRHIVWDILTDYDGLAEIVPVLRTSAAVLPGHHTYAPPARQPRNVVRVRQVVQRRLPYLWLQTEVYLDVLERRSNDGRMELQFRQVRGSGKLRPHSPFETLQVRTPGAAFKLVLKGHRPSLAAIACCR